MKEASECIIMLDNASIHSSNQTLKTINKMNMSCQFLHAYSPSLAPVELFFRILKNKLRRTLHNEGIWFSKLAERVKIYKSIENIDKLWIKELWIEFIKNAKKAIIQFN